ncbi:MAG: 3-dehydroquinate synthase [Crocinitomicaceae bacterium]
MSDILKYNHSSIHFGKLSGGNFEKILTEQYADAKKVIITDENVFKLWGEDLVTSFSELSKAEIIQIPAGEAYKTIEVCTQIWEALSEYEIGRNDLVINLGGGVVTDLGGLVATLFKRGLRFINIPTTLLAQVDASVGGKTAVDLGPYKNQIGLFSDANHVFIDEKFLSTLDDEQLLSGYAEMLKHALISDSAYWEKLKKVDPLSTKNRAENIRHSVMIKKQIVEQDYKESGKRKVLNFGHTIGHGIEGYLLKKETPTLHGYAVVWGMIAETYLAVDRGLLDQHSADEVIIVLRSIYPPFSLSQEEFKEVLALLYNDKKNKEGQLQFSLINAIGSCVYDQEVTDKEVLNALKKLCTNF